MRLIIVRHGESHSNASRDRVALPEPEGDRLTDRGREQAAAAADAVAELGADRLITSPMRRAAETAAVIGERLGLAAETSELIHELREVDGYGELEPSEQQAKRWSKRMSENADNRHFAPAGAESFADVVERVHRFKQSLAGQPADSVQVAVSHGIFTRFFLLDSVLGPAFSPAHLTRIWHLRTINCGLSLFTLGERGRAIDPQLDDWACLSWMSPSSGPQGLRRVASPGGAHEPASEGLRRG